MFVELQANDVSISTISRLSLPTSPLDAEIGDEMPKALATTCERHASPTVWALDGDDNVLIQGHRADPAMLREVSVGDDEVVVVIPKALLRSAIASDLPNA